MGWPVGVTFSFREVVGFIAEGEDLESPFVGGGRGGRGRAWAGRGVEYLGFFWGGKGEGEEGEGFFLRYLLSFFFSSFLPSLLLSY